MPPETFGELVGVIIGFLNDIFVLIVALTLVVFLFGLVRFIASVGGDEKAEGKSLMFWGVVALFLEISVWGVVALVSNTFF